MDFPFWKHTQKAAVKHTAVKWNPDSEQRTHSFTERAFQHPRVFQFWWGIINQNYFNACLPQTVHVFQDSITEQNISLRATAQHVHSNKALRAGTGCQFYKMLFSSRYTATANPSAINKKFILTPLTSKYTNQGTDFTITASLYDCFSSCAMTWEHVLLGRDWDFYSWEHPRVTRE